MRTQRAYPETADAAVESAILGEDQTIDLLNVVGMLRRRKWLIMLVTALGTAAAAFLGMKQHTDLHRQFLGDDRPAPAPDHHGRAGGAGAADQHVRPWPRRSG